MYLQKITGQDFHTAPTLLYIHFLDKGCLWEYGFVSERYGVVRKSFSNVDDFNKLLKVLLRQLSAIVNKFSSSRGFHNCNFLVWGVYGLKIMTLSLKTPNFWTRLRLLSLNWNGWGSWWPIFKHKTDFVRGKIKVTFALCKYLEGSKIFQ